MKELRGGIDPAALAVASLAAVVSTIAPPGPYHPKCMLIGLAILLVIFGYDVEPTRKRKQNLAFGVVCALISLLVLGYPLEFFFSFIKTHEWTRLKVMLGDQEHDINHSEVPPGVMLGLWVLMTYMYYWCDKRRCRQVARRTQC